jgi:nitroimidazol reductase NimA-like FMN-containing flavoprotein (pyridoxamine 5'-phosphate oxidase superfamily)
MSARAHVKRAPRRGVYDRRVIDALLDEGFVCHVGFVVDGQPYVIPTAYARAGDVLYLHGARGNRALRSLRDGAQACVTVTLVDGLVIARSVYHHSINYRSVVVFGKAVEVTDEREKLAALQAVVEHLVPGRWDDARRPSEQELKATLVVAVAIEEVSAKVRTGHPNDDAEDYDLPVWAGVLPLALRPAQPVADPRLAFELAPPPYVAGYTRPRDDEAAALIAGIQ